MSSLNENSVRTIDMLSGKSPLEAQLAARVLNEAILCPPEDEDHFTAAQAILDAARESKLTQSVLDSWDLSPEVLDVHLAEDCSEEDARLKHLLTLAAATEFSSREWHDQIVEAINRNIRGIIAEMDVWDREALLHGLLMRWQLPKEHTALRILQHMYRAHIMSDLHSD